MYILKVWICTCLIASIISIMVLYSDSYASFGNFKDFLGSYIIFVIMSLLFSIPTFIVLSIIKMFFNKERIPLKLIFNIIGVLGVIISLHISVWSSFTGNGFKTFVFPFSLSISFFIWFFKIDKAKHIS